MAEPSTVISHKLPAIPDMRFESSYLKKIQPFVRVETNDTVSGSSRDELPHEVIKVQWTIVIWVTIRDQVMSPFVQGILL